MTITDEQVEAAAKVLRICTTRDIRAALEAAQIASLQAQYPTQDAYDLACAAIEKHRSRADAAEAEVTRLRAQVKGLGMSFVRSRKLVPSMT